MQPFPTILNQVLNAQLLQQWFPNTKMWMSAATFERATSPVSVEVVTGACMMIKRDVFCDVGGFSSDYFMYAEDVDLCHKIRARGLTNYYVQWVQVVHHGEKYAAQGESLLKRDEAGGCGPAAPENARQHLRCGLSNCDQRCCHNPIGAASVVFPRRDDSARDADVASGVRKVDRHSPLEGPGSGRLGSRIRPAQRRCGRARRGQSIATCALVGSLTIGGTGNRRLVQP